MYRDLMRGDYGYYCALMERHGLPIDVDTLDFLKDNWDGIKSGLCELVADTGIYDENQKFSVQRFAEYLNREGLGWPRLFSGALDLQDSSFATMERAYPKQIGPIRQVRRSLSNTRLFDGITVGPDNRNRCGLSMFGAKTARHTPSNAKFLPGTAAWLRGLIKPEPETTVAYIDYSSQEFAIGAYLSGDEKMIAAYESGDPYLALAKFSGAVPPEGTKQTHKEERHLFKAVVLGVGFGMSFYGLSDRIDKPLPYAKELLRHHHEQFREYWKWVDSAIGLAMAELTLHTCFNWQLHIGRPTTVDDKPNPRSIGNFVSQAHGSEMLRLAVSLLVEDGIKVIAPVHDALMIECRTDVADETIERASYLMQEASRVILKGNLCRTDAHIVHAPSRFMDERGVEFWNHVARLLDRPDLHFDPTEAK